MVRVVNFSLQICPHSFANFGNTCYMNAVLQSLVGMEPFANDILNQKLVQAAQKGSLYL